MISSYSELVVWQRGMDLVEEVYSLTKRLPQEERYALIDQIRRSVTSIPSNIAEGQGRSTTREFIHYLSIAKGSKNEVETQLLICVKVGYLEKKEIEKALAISSEIGRMLTKLRKSLENRLGT